MGKFNLSDIVALAKQGYSVSDVKELIALTSSEETKPTEDKENQDKKTEQHEAGKEQPEEAPKKSTDKSSEVIAIDEYKKKIEELEGKLSKLQESNATKDNSEKHEKSDEDIALDLARSYM